MSHKRIQKGEYGYRGQAKRDRIFICVLLLVSILIQVAIRSVTNMNAFRILFTITAIITVLPLGTIASPLIASWRYHTPDIAFYDEVHPYEEKFTILYDLILTTKEQMIPLDAAIVHPIGIFAYCPDQKVDEKKAEAGLNELLSSARLDDRLHIMKDMKAFERRLESLKPASDYEDDGVVKAEADMLKSLCM